MNNSLLPTLLLVVFITLKLLGYIAWSWWWVLSPLWITAAVAIAFAAFIGLFIRKSAKRMDDIRSRGFHL